MICTCVPFGQNSCSTATTEAWKGLRQNFYSDKESSNRRRREWERQSESKCNGASGDAYRRRQCQYPCHFGTLSFGADTPQTTHMWYVHIHTCACVCVRGSVFVCALPNGAKSEAHSVRQAGRQARVIDFSIKPHLHYCHRVIAQEIRKVSWPFLPCLPACQSAGIDKKIS